MSSGYVITIYYNSGNIVQETHHLDGNCYYRKKVNDKTDEWTLTPHRNEIENIYTSLTGKLNNRMTRLPDGSNPKLAATEVGLYTVNNPANTGLTGWFDFILMKDDNNAAYRKIIGVHAESILYAYESGGNWSPWNIVGNTGAIGYLKTKDKSSIVNAVNEVNSFLNVYVTTADWVPEDLGLPMGGSCTISFNGTASAAITNSLLNTSLKGVISRTSAKIFDFFGTSGNISDPLSGKIGMSRYENGVWGKWVTFNVGNTSDLKTVDKSSVVNAVNEVNDKLQAQDGTISPFDANVSLGFCQCKKYPGGFVNIVFDLKVSIQLENSLTNWYNVAKTSIRPANIIYFPVVYGGGYAAIGRCDTQGNIALKVGINDYTANSWAQGNFCFEHLK